MDQPGHQTHHHEGTFVEHRPSIADLHHQSTGHRQPEMTHQRRPSFAHETRLIGPGAPVDDHHSHVRYVLVTQDMLSQMNHGHPPTVPLIHATLQPPAPIGSESPVSSVQPLSPTSEPTDKFGNVTHHEVMAAKDYQDTNATGRTPSSVDDDEDDDAPYLVNPLSRLRFKYKEYLGEFLGTMVLILFGNGVNCQVVLSELTQGSYLSISFGWGIGVMFGVYACGGVSGAHINPAVTIALAVFRGFPWRKVPGYALAQILGACLGSCLIQGNYHALINQFEGGYNLRTYGLETSTGPLFFTDTKPYMSNIGAFCSELLATAVLMGLILAISDPHNNPVPKGMNGFALLWLIIGIGAALGTETAYCLNPARDLGPRIACAIFGYPKVIWTYRSCYWIYTPIIATIVGALVGSFFYDFFVFDGKDSPLNKAWGRKKDTLPASREKV